MTLSLQDKVALLPRKTGVYKFLDSKNNIIYIGKALNLKSRVSSYFNSNHTDRPRMIGMIPLIANLETIETDNEIEALVLEAALIRKHQPKFNTDLKDDKSYAWIYIDTQSQFPTVKVVRSLNEKEYKKGRLFGPYPNSRATRRIFNYLRKLYPFCTNKQPKKDELCFYYHLGLCPGPHQDRITEEDYRKNIDNIIRFLTGRKKGQIEKIERKMRRYAKAKEFEKAATLRDQISDLKHLGHKLDFTYFTEEGAYMKSKGDQLREQSEELREELGLKKLDRIECYDVSNIKGKLAFGSMVVTIDGFSTNNLYRVFKIKGKDTPDDPGMLKEVLERRLKHIGNGKDESLSAQPDLILIDGGKSQLGVLKDIVPDHIPLMGISKGKNLKRKKKLQIDEFWVRDGKGVIVQIEINQPRIFINLRDESHRFALLHHRKLRKFVQKKSILDEIKGIGPKRKKALIQKYGSTKGIAKVSEDKLYEIIKDMKVVKALKKALSK